ncbi:hypothetical protein BDV18DRAFT_131975 [Aspergillus unguis]
MNPLYPLQPAGEGIWLYEPPSTSTTSTASPASPNEHPKLIVLCTWLGGATPRRIAKYVGYHRQLFPRSAILLIMTGMLDITVRSFSVIRKRLRPARETIRQILSQNADAHAHANADAEEDSAANVTGNGKGRGGVLLHIFSHGGTNIAIQLILSMQDHDRDSKHTNRIPKLPLLGIVFDSCPGDTSFMRNYRASVYSLPPAFLPIRILEEALLFPAIGVITALQKLGITGSISAMQKQLNDSIVVSARVPRLYLFSKADETIAWEEVQAHFEDARERGYVVERVVFEKSPHCALIVEDEKRYWGAVRRFWEATVQANVEVVKRQSICIQSKL